MKIHKSEIRSAQSTTEKHIVDMSKDFLDIDLDKFEDIFNGIISFSFYFTKSGKKTIRAFQTKSYEEIKNFIKFYSNSIEFFEINDEWQEINVSENGFI